MRVIHVNEISDLVARLCLEANRYYSPDVNAALRQALTEEKSPVGKECLLGLIKNGEIAQTEQLPICQDTGMAVVFVEYGQAISVAGGDFFGAVNEGVRRGYREGYFRQSIVRDPLDRVNTGDNTPAVIHSRIVPGDKLRITVAPKGFGSENMSRVAMLTPSQGKDGIKKAVLDTVYQAGANPCPPVIVGVGVGGTMEMAALIAKEALLRDIGSLNPNEFWAEFESELLAEINKLGIGPQGLGGNCTALAVHINTYPTHIAGLPVAVNMCCHVNRHRTGII